ncbi:MAG: hypothetical protein A3C11_00125 [Candidatus Sungbacteria bacterium RIFCSPHIGHO2_02_FULL_49_12]|uniref:Uncharacterized protein n=1 Tax=Candidatus Sungbacteria bacterium RIFCSPHIGHO2_02_FULL_49_12 TaxID=1802271 RepID=A0A1G2KQP7_9BACT|nr:MAG: hypothetical protein A3C11_00125 [Candidatus Sungbacteria bacterium RIFCSPHIGHO2_02_FULL_49_12]
MLNRIRYSNTESHEIIEIQSSNSKFDIIGFFVRHGLVKKRSTAVKFTLAIALACMLAAVYIFVLTLPRAGYSSSKGYPMLDRTTLPAPRYAPSGIPQ